MKIRFRKLLLILILITQLSSGFTSSAFAQVATPSATLAPSATPTPAQYPTQQVIQQLPDLSSTSSGQFLEDGINNPYPSFSNPQGQFSATTKVFPIIRTLSKRSFRANERVGVSIDNADNSPVDVIIVDKNGQEADFDFFTIDNGSRKTVTVKPKRGFKPGKYTITVTTGGQTYTQDFTWGVLAINTNKSIYLSSEARAKEGLPPETANIAMAVLDETGMMVCDADVELRIKNQELGIDDTLSTGNGRIVVNPDCSVKDYTLKPDYEASYQVQNAGFYDLTLTAQTNNGIYSITDSFEVRESVPFDVERITATRIFPVNTYPVTINITANQDFQGVITEAVPGDFAVEQSPQSDIPFTQTQNISQTAIGQLIGASSSAKLGLPFSGDYPISLEFGEKLKNEYEKNLYQQFNLAGHDGVDFDMPVGTPILAADDGTVVMAGGEIYGTTVVIQHSWGRSYYGHLSKTNVIMGQKVSKGEEIALSGNTGFTTGPHLHFGIKPNSTNIDNGYYGKIDPLPFLGIESKLDSSKLTKVISWSANLKKGDKLKLEYIYKAPNISPQFYKLGFLRFFENSSNIFEETRQWQIAVDAPNNQFVKVGSFTKKTSTGSQSVTGIGFKPKAIIFYWTNQTANGTVSEGSNVAGSQGMGFATGSANEAALSGWDEGQTAATTLDNGRATYNNASIVIQGNLGALTLGVADFTSFDPDGFTLNWSVADANAYIIYYYALSETIVSNATVNSFSFTTGTGNLSVTNAGFQPDFVLFMTGGTTTHGSNTANGMIFTIGAASSSTSEWTTAAYSTEAVSAADLSDDCAWQRTDASIALIGTTVACGTTTEDALADFTQFTSTGFDINKSNAPAGAFDVFYLALKGNATSFSVGSFNKPTATGNNSVSISNFQPAGLMLASRSMVSSTTVDSGSATAGIFSMGATSGLSQEGAISRAGIDNVDASTPDFRTSSTKAISAVKGDGTLTGEANLASFDSSGFTLKWTTADATADQYLYWSIGEILTPPDLMRHGKWFHNGVEQPFAF